MESIKIGYRSVYGEGDEKKNLILKNVILTLFSVFFLILTWRSHNEDLTFHEKLRKLILFYFKKYTIMFRMIVLALKESNFYVFFLCGNILNMKHFCSIS